MWSAALAPPQSPAISKILFGSCCRTLMAQKLPDSLRNTANQRVLEYLAGKSAHSDIGDALIKATKPLGDVQIYCPDPAQCKYLAVSSNGVIFGFATGMKAIAFRLNAIFKERALKTGADDRPELGTE